MYEESKSLNKANDVRTDLVLSQLCRQSQGEKGGKLVGIRHGEN